MHYTTDFTQQIIILFTQALDFNCISHRTDNGQASAAYTATTEKSGEAVLADNIALLTQEVETSPLLMSEEQEAQFCLAIKAGVYKSLHQKGLLTDAQLFQLLSKH